MKYSSLRGKVIVITGASSGLGKLSVEEFLKEGACVVLAARSEREMREHLQNLNVGDDQAIVIKTDVSQYEQVKNLAEEALDHFLKVDVWINNAGVNLYGYVEELRIEDIQRVIDVNLMGHIYGMKVALDIFNRQGYGNILNVASVFGIASSPLASAYCASKHGILGFSCALRQELMTAKYKNKTIDVVDILPASMDTPLTLHAKSILGLTPKPLSPVYDPHLAVEAMIKHAKTPKPMTVVGGAGWLMTWEARLMPVFFERLMSMLGIGGQLTDEPKPPEGHDNLYRPMPGNHKIRGGFKPLQKHVSAK